MCVASLQELSDLAGQDLSELDPHRPFVDDVTLVCPECGETANRVPEVIDVWYDSGAMPFAQWGYPHQNTELFDQRYPADFICEAIDQTRGWFYTLMAIGELVFEESAYKNVLCLGHILDAQGRKMSKNLGNVLEPIGLMDRHGADAVRWFMLAAGSAWQSRRVSDDTIGDVVRKTLLTYWNTASFLSLYGRIADFDPSSSTIPAANERPALDRWALSRANSLIVDVEQALEDFDTQTAGRLIASFVDDLSNWYVRRSRRRFWDGDPAALATLHECVRTVTLLMAPFTPFITERVWTDLVGSVDPQAPESVHLAAWPTAETKSIDPALHDQVDLVRRLVELGRAARADSKVKTRQPLRRALVGAAGWEEVPADLAAEVTEELNVLTIVRLDASDGDLVDVTVKPNFRELGKRFGKQTPKVAKAIEQSNVDELVGSLKDVGSYAVTADGEQCIVTSEDVVVTERPREGWAVSSASGETVALDLALDDELILLGTTRDIVREIQQQRKDRGFDVTDRITVLWSSADDQAAQAMRQYTDAIAKEVLAVAITEDDSLATGATHAVELLDGRMVVQATRR